MMTLLQLSFYCVTVSLVQAEFTNRETTNSKENLQHRFGRKHTSNNGHIECLEGLLDFITQTYTSTFMPVNWFSLEKLIFAYLPLRERQMNPISHYKKSFIWFMQTMAIYLCVFVMYIPSLISFYFFCFWSSLPSLSPSKGLFGHNLLTGQLMWVGN